MDVITVKVGRLPGRIEEIALNGGRTVADAIGAADLDSDGAEIRVNGSPAEMNHELRQGDTVLLVNRIKGNSMTVKVGRLPGRIEEIALEDGQRVGDAIEAADVWDEDCEIRVNGSPAAEDTVLHNGDTVLLVKKIKGN